jgi:hypothetical protein
MYSVLVVWLLLLLLYRLMGKVAAGNCHKWVYRDPLENGISSYLPPWHGSLDPVRH